MPKRDRKEYMKEYMKKYRKNNVDVNTATTPTVTASNEVILKLWKTTNLKRKKNIEIQERTAKQWENELSFFEIKNEN